jgi:hypothetical protein
MRLSLILLHTLSMQPPISPECMARIKKKTEMACASSKPSANPEVGEKTDFWVAHVWQPA